MTTLRINLYPLHDDGRRKSRHSKGESFLFPFMTRVIAELKQQGKIRTSETYIATLRSFKLFREGEDILLDELNGELIAEYEVWMRKRALTRNTTSFYMRILRATYNRAVDRNLTLQRFPFRHVYTGVEKTIKRAIPIEMIRSIKELDLAWNPVLRFARDMFLFSFYTRGMSFVDMAYLVKTDLANDTLSYRRKKTGQMMYIRNERCIHELITRYGLPDSPYLLPIIRDLEKDPRRQYLNEEHRVNENLKRIGLHLGLPLPLTLYVARHAWASVARYKNIPISVISEGMGHNSEMTTRIYLASLDTEVVDKANGLILQSLDL